MKRIAAVFILFLLLMTGGCVKKYTGVYFIQRSDSSISAEDLKAQLIEVVAPFGFRYEKMFPNDPGTFGFIKNMAFSNPDLANLPGANANVTISIWHSEIAISISDRDNDKETKYVHALKEAIRQRLVARYNIQDIKFVQQSNFIFNN